MKRSNRRHAGLATVSDRVKPYAEAAQERVEPVVGQALERVGPAVEHARERIAPAVEHAKDKVAPAVEDARDRLVDDLVPKVAAALAVAQEKGGPYRDEAMRRGAAAVAALRGEIELAKPKKKGRWLRRLLVLAGLAGAGAAAYRFLSGGAEPSWQPTPPPAPPTSSHNTSTNAASSSPTSSAAQTTGAAAAGASRKVGEVKPSGSSGTGSSGTGSSGTGSSGTGKSPTDKTTGKTTAESDDAAGASPDEALADQNDGEKSKPTTPDKPAHKHAESTTAAKPASNSGPKNGNSSKSGQK